VDLRGVDSTEIVDVVDVVDERGATTIRASAGLRPSRRTAGQLRTGGALNVRPFGVQLSRCADEGCRVSTPLARRRSLRAELREAVLRGCAAIGLAAGLVWGLEHQVRPSCSAVGRAGSALNRCTSHSISVIATHWGLALGGGFVAGGLVGVLLALAIGIEKT
jgi:hypothetical protein